MIRVHLNSDRKVVHQHLANLNAYSDLTNQIFLPRSKNVEEGSIESLCSGCGNLKVNEYDEDRIFCYHNNLILLGNFFKNYNLPKGYVITHKDVSRTELLAVLRYIPMYEVPDPPLVKGRPMKKHDLVDYIVTCIKTSSYST
jgi:hypothetical protein